MAIKGPYQITLTTTPQPIDLLGEPGEWWATSEGGARLAWVCHDSDWYFGGPDMTGAAGAMPGALVKAGQPLNDAPRGSDRCYAAVADGTAVLHRFPGGL